MIKITIIKVTIITIPASRLVLHHYNFNYCNFDCPKIILYFVFILYRFKRSQTLWINMNSQFFVIHFKYQSQCVYKNRKDKKRSYIDAHIIIYVSYRQNSI